VISCAALDGKRMAMSMAMRISMAMSMKISMAMRKFKLG
jgi:hypothetical protein